jgi:hypothetical protein
MANKTLSEEEHKKHNDEIEKRIQELGDKSTQILTFLSFAIVVVATLGTSSSLAPTQKQEMSSAMRWWIAAVFPVLIGIAPLKELAWKKPGWYSFVRWLKFGLLWVSVFLILCGLRQFSHVV